MGFAKGIGIVRIVAGGFGLLYGSFSDAKDTHSAKAGPLGRSVQEQQSVKLPVALSARAVASGVILPVVGFGRT